MLPPAEPKWRRRKAARPAEITAAALEVFAEKGFAAARLDDIARAAGVSKGALYLYFETKEELFAAVVRETIAPRIEMVTAMAQAYEGPFADLARMIAAQVSEIAASTSIGGVVKMVIGESRNFPEIARLWHDALVAKALALVSGLIEKAQGRGEIRPGDARLYALGIISPLLLSVIWRETFVPIGAEPIDLKAIATQHIDTVLRGMLTQEVAA
ncbi:MAG: TetR/AcrR family transcriptional regulator [Caulobacteraceae bacterium]